MKYTQIPASTFQNIQLNAGILVDDFEVNTGKVGNLLGATTGGVQFQDNITYTDFGEDIDNCPKNTMELKKLDAHDVSMSGTFVTLSPDVAKMLVAVGDVDGDDKSHIIPRNELLITDFTSLWWIGDYSNVNTGDRAGFVAIKMLNALNTGGFQIQSTDKGKGQFAFTFTGHYSIKRQDLVPYEVYIRQGGIENPTLSAMADDSIVFGELVGDLQDNVSIADGKITGTLKYLDAGQLVDRWGAGNFMAIQFTADDWSEYESVKAGMDPSRGDGLVEIINDPDKNGVWKVSDKDSQVFKVVGTSGDYTKTETYDLTGLVLEEE